MTDTTNKAKITFPDGRYCYADYDETNNRIKVDNITEVFNKDGKAVTNTILDWNNNVGVEYHNGDYCKGGFVNGKLNGQVTYTWADGNHYYGDFVNGKMEGEGRRTVVEPETKNLYLHKYIMKMDL